MEEIRHAKLYNKSLNTCQVINVSSKNEFFRIAEDISKQFPTDVFRLSYDYAPAHECTSSCSGKWHHSLEYEDETAFYELQNGEWLDDMW